MKLKELRKSLGLTHEDMALALGISIDQYARIEKSERMKKSQVITLSRYLGDEIMKSCDIEEY